MTLTEFLWTAALWLCLPLIFDGQLRMQEGQGAAQPWSMVPVLGVAVAVLLAVCAVSGGMNAWQEGLIQQLRKRLERNGVQNCIKNTARMKGSVMQSCSSALCILILLISTFTTAVSAHLKVKVKLHDSATLPCSERCSGLVRWSVFHKPTDILAECDQTSCRSVKEGYQMIHDLYLKGNLSLTITDADFSKRGWYTSDCDGKDLCDVTLQIEPLNTTVRIKPGESLVLKLDVSDAVEVIYNSTEAANQSSGQICTVNGRSTQCKPEYTQRVSLTSALELRAVTPSDSGFYTVVDKRNEEVIHIYTVTVQDGQLRMQEGQGAAQSGWMVPVLGVAVAVLLAVCAVSVGMNVWQRRKIQQLRKEGKKKKRKKDVSEPETQQ